jgi:large subunit ribosomal protein LP2
MIEAAAYLLCKLGGKARSAADIKAILEAAGVTAINKEVLAQFTSDVDGKDVNELLATGVAKIKDVPFGGGGGGGGGSNAPAAEAVKEEEPEEEEMDMGGAVDMFGGGEAKSGDY